MNFYKQVLLATVAFGLLGASPAWAVDPCDMDGDGSIAISCGGADCDDNDPNRFPGNAEACDAFDVDEDCDPLTFGGVDSDGDGFISDRCCNVQEDGSLLCGRDCGPSHPTVSPVAPDVCDGRDNDCDGVVDQHAASQFADLDRDGHGDPNEPMGRVCPGTEGFSPLSNDCDDLNPAIEPGDLVCDPATGPDAYQYCASDGQWVTGQVCATGSVCVAQDNGTGVCIPEKLKDKDKA